MPTQLDDLRGLTVERLREMRLHPGVYSRALIAQALDARGPETMDTPPDAPDAPRPEGERPSGFRQDVQRGYRSGLQGVADAWRGAGQWMQKGNDEEGRRFALSQMRGRMPAQGAFEYFNRQTPERQGGQAVASFLDENADMLAASPREFEAFVANPQGYIQMKQRVLTPRDAPQQAMAAQGGGGGQPDVAQAPPQSPQLPPGFTMGPQPGLPQGFTMGPNGDMLPPQQPDIPPWLRPREAQTGAVGEGGSTAGGRQTPRPAGLAAPTQSPAITAIATGQQAAAATVAPEAAAVSQAVDGMSPELKQATQDYMKILGEDSDTKQQDQFMSLAKAGFATAASRSPYLLQAVGEGGLAGIDDYQRSRGRQAERRLRGAEGRLRVADIGERARATMRDDVRADKTLALATTAQGDTVADRAVHRTLEERGLGIQERSAATAEESNRIRAAEVNRADRVPLGQDEEGHAILYDRHSDTYSVGPKVQTLGRGAPSVFSQRLEAYRKMYPEEEALARASGARRSTPAENYRAAEVAAKNKASLVNNSKEALEVYNRTLAQVLADLNHSDYAGVAAPAGAGAPAPADPFGIRPKAP